MSATILPFSPRDRREICANCGWSGSQNFPDKLWCSHPSTEGMTVQPNGTCHEFERSVGKPDG